MRRLLRLMAVAVAPGFGLEVIGHDREGLYDSSPSAYEVETTLENREPDWLPQTAKFSARAGSPTVTIKVAQPTE